MYIETETIEEYKTGFTPEQRYWFNRRDRHRCQWINGHGNQCEERHTFKHHIHYQRNFKKEERDNGIVNQPMKNCPDNGISLCRYHHQVADDIKEIAVILEQIAHNNTMSYLETHPEDQFPEGDGFYYPDKTQFQDYFIPQLYPSQKN